MTLRGDFRRIVRTGLAWVPSRDMIVIVMNEGDHPQEWFEAGAIDGFWVSPDVNEIDIDTFADEVIPLLRERGVYPADYEGTTLREHLGVPYQCGLEGASRDVPRLDATTARATKRGLPRRLHSGADVLELRSRRPRRQ